MIDTHCHLTDSRFDAGEIITNMKDDGLEAVVSIGFDTESSVKSSILAETYENVYAAVGLQPEELGHENSLDGIIGLVEKKSTVAIGETGLDYHFPDNPDRDIQKAFFNLHLDLAEQCHKPVVIHSRDCDGDMLPILKKHAKLLDAGVLIHCFSSSKEIAVEYAKLGFYIAFGGAITFKNANKGDIIRAVPDELLLTETDAPYLTPVPFRGQLNYPKYVRYVIEKLAFEKNMSFEEVERLTALNAKRLFKIK